MRLLKYFGVALDSIRAHTLRAVLTMLGIIIGITAVLVTVGIGSGAAASITDRIESSGSNLLTISAGMRGSSSGATLTMADAGVLADTELFPNVVNVAPQYSGNSTVVAGATGGSYQVAGTTPAYPRIRNLEVAAGGFFTDAQVEENAMVAVLGDTVASDLFGGQEPVGQSVRFDDALFKVIGVLEASGSAGFGSSDSQVFVPINVALGRLYNVTRHRGSYTISSITAQVDAEENLDATAYQIEQVLRLRHGLGEDDDNDFQLQNQADLLEMVGEISGTLSVLLGGIGAVSLVVGGIGIMNIMLVSVTERTREIGLRKALGAHDSDILFQFLIEALVLCALGGLIGIGLAYAIAYLVALLLPNLGIGIVIETWAVGLALAVATTSGFVFGLYPAMRATRLDPIEALRYE